MRLRFYDDKTRSGFLPSIPSCSPSRREVGPTTYHKVSKIGPRQTKVDTVGLEKLHLAAESAPSEWHTKNEITARRLSFVVYHWHQFASVKILIKYHAFRIVPYLKDVVRNKARKLSNDAHHPNDVWNSGCQGIQQRRQIQDLAGDAETRISLGLSPCDDVIQNHVLNDRSLNPPVAVISDFVPSSNWISQS